MASILVQEKAPKVVLHSAFSMPCDSVVAVAAGVGVVLEEEEEQEEEEEEGGGGGGGRRRREEEEGGGGGRRRRRKEEEEGGGGGRRRRKEEEEECVVGLGWSVDAATRMEPSEVLKHEEKTNNWGPDQFIFSLLI